jgi:hypothetical protein
MGRRGFRKSISFLVLSLVSGGRAWAEAGSNTREGSRTKRENEKDHGNENEEEPERAYFVCR